MLSLKHWNWGFLVRRWMSSVGSNAPGWLSRTLRPCLSQSVTSEKAVLASHCLPSLGLVWALISIASGFQDCDYLLLKLLLGKALKCNFLKRTKNKCVDGVISACVRSCQHHCVGSAFSWFWMRSSLIDQLVTKNTFSFVLFCFVFSSPPLSFLEPMLFNIPALQMVCDLSLLSSALWENIRHKPLRPWWERSQ